jgi:uncharacterized membrane protein YkvA (DUF1232 family)
MPAKFDRETLEDALREGMAKVNPRDLLKLAQRWPTLRRLIRGPLADLADDVTTLVAMVKDYAAGNYREVPQKTVLAAAAALFYILNPFDLIPDLVPALGLMDDAAVLTMVVKAIQSDIHNYRSWTHKTARRMRQIVARI